MGSISISSSNFPSMADILEASRAQNLDLQLQTVGPFFRVTARKLDGGLELGRAEGVVRAWWVDHHRHQQHKDKVTMKKILHLDSMRLKRETLGIERSIFGIGLFIGAVAVRHGYDQGCSVAQLLAINDSDLYHSKLVRFYSRIGFKPVHEVNGSSMADLAHMLVWGGRGTRMDADIQHLLFKWCTRFSPKTSQ